MYCSNCRYNLRDARAFRCAECGQSFDPDDQSTYRRQASGQDSEPGRLDWLGWSAIGCFTVPYMMLLWVQATWVVGWMELGDPPNAMSPNPRQVTGLATQASLSILDLLSTLVVPSLGLCVVLLVVQMVRSFPDHEKVKPFVKTLVICIALFITACCLLVFSAVSTPAGHWLID